MLSPEKFNIRSYETFRERAQDPTLTANEKCACPEAFRAGRSATIFADIATKLTTLAKTGARVLDIGCGCSDLALYIVETTGKNGQLLTVIDSPEMLSWLPDAPHLTKVPGPFPDCLKVTGQPLAPFDAILTYSVVQTIFLESNLSAFVDAAVQLLSEGGRFLIGDIPNTTMRKRFMVSSAGNVYHKKYYSDRPEPNVVFNILEPGEIDDGIVIGLLARMRTAGLHAFVMPQEAGLPMANRREDILIVRP